MPEYIQHHTEDRISYIILNRPEKRNAFHPDLVTELKAAFRSEMDNSKSRIIILKGNGKAFSAGADLKYIQGLQENSYEENLADSQHLQELFELIYEHPKPVIAQVEGHAIAGGCGLATVCDFIYSIPEAKFAYTEVKIGFVPAIVMLFLIRKVGDAKARELLLSGNLYQAEEFHNLGLINELVSADEIDAFVKKKAEDLMAACSGDSWALTKQLMAQVQDLPWKDALNLAAQYNAKARSTKDCKKGIASFLNKKSIIW